MLTFVYRHSNPIKCVEIMFWYLKQKMYSDENGLNMQNFMSIGTNTTTILS